MYAPYLLLHLHTILRYCIANSFVITVLQRLSPLLRLMRPSNDHIMLSLSSYISYLKGECILSLQLLLRKVCEG